ncbi:MAG: T9SS type A sorting domain-containing protein [Bacteroidia bacterium]
MGKLRITLLFLILSNLLFSQTGPGGIGSTSSNGIWLRANDISQVDATAVSSWADFSGNSNDAGQATASLQPLFYNTSSINNMPIVRLDGSNDEMAIPDAAILDGTTGITYYVVLRPNNLNGAARGILGKRITFTTAVEYAYTWFFYGSNYINLDIHTQNDRFTSTPTAFVNANNYVIAFDYNGALTAAQRSRLYRNGSTIKIASETSTSLPNSNQDVAIGALNVGYGTYLGADYAEIIHFNYSLDTTEHIIVSNYLAAKYNITLSHNDLYDEDDAGNGNYDFQVAGIGRIDASTIHSDSKGDGIVRISNPNDLNDLEFMFWGHNNGIQQATNTSDVPAGVQARFDRVWRVSEVNTSNTPIDVGSVDMQWDLTGLGSVTASDLRLLIDTDNDGVFVDETPISGASFVSGSTYQFTGVTGLSNNLRFTLATINKTQTPLPITLTSFEAKLNQNKTVVSLDWETASEINNDFFTLEKSYDASTWFSIGTIKGNGSTSVPHTYSFKDDNVKEGKIYYRLLQTDFNSVSSISSIKSVDVNYTKSNLRLYPNPANTAVVISGDNEELKTVKIYNANGKLMRELNSLLNDLESELTLSLEEFPKGLYFVVSQKKAYKLLVN